MACTHKLKDHFGIRSCLLPGGSSRQSQRGGKVGVIFYLELGNKIIFLIPMPLAVQNLVD